MGFWCKRDLFRETINLEASWRRETKDDELPELNDIAWRKSRISHVPVGELEEHNANYRCSTLNDATEH
jgi:hypothetical protein